jgi:Rhodopirellula transposase DDE domain
MMSSPHSAVPSDPPGTFGHWCSVLPLLNETQTRVYVAQKALELGRGGISTVAELTGLSRPTIPKGIRELRAGIAPETAVMIRKKGGGRTCVEAVDATLLRDLEAIMEEKTAGDPMSCLKWTGKSSGKIAHELTAQGHQVNPRTVCRLLKEMGVSLRANVKADAGAQHPDRDAHFRYINQQAKAFTQLGDPIISVDTKQKAVVGNFKNAGQTWRREDTWVTAHDVPSQAVGQAIPYGVYEIQANVGMVNGGISHDTAEFAVESMTKWWKSVGRIHSGRSKRLLICADSGGSHGSRARVWKVALQQFSATFHLKVTVLPYPPGTRKWNKIEPKMCSFISMNWKGEPLVSYEAVVNLISTTTTKSGVKVVAELDQNTDETGINISDKPMDALHLRYHKKHPAWNYTVSPRRPKRIYNCKFYFCVDPM